MSPLRKPLEYSFSVVWIAVLFVGAYPLRANETKGKCDYAKVGAANVIQIELNLLGTDGTAAGKATKSNRSDTVHDLDRTLKETEPMQTYHLSNSLWNLSWLYGASIRSHWQRGRGSYAFSIEGHDDKLFLYPRSPYGTGQEHTQVDYGIAERVFREVKGSEGSEYLVRVHRYVPPARGVLGHLVLDKIENGTLEEQLNRDKRVRVEFGHEGEGKRQTLKTLKQIALGLKALHAKGWVHGDIKLANVGLDDELNAKILDLQNAVSTTQRIRSAVHPIGITPEYASKQWLEEDALGFHTDLHALSVLAMELVLETKLKEIPSPHVRILSHPKFGKYPVVDSTPKEIDSQVPTELSEMVIRLRSAKTIDESLEIINDAISMETGQLAA